MYSPSVLPRSGTLEWAVQSSCMTRSPGGREWSYRSMECLLPQLWSEIVGKIRIMSVGGYWGPAVHRGVQVRVEGKCWDWDLMVCEQAKLQKSAL